MICHFSKLQALVSAAPDWSLVFTHPAGKAENYHDESRSCPSPKDPEINVQSRKPHHFCTRESESAFCHLKWLLIHPDGVRGHIWSISAPKRRSQGLFSAILCENSYTFWPTDSKEFDRIWVFDSLNFIFRTLTSVESDFYWTLLTCVYTNWPLFSTAYIE